MPRFLCQNSKPHFKCAILLFKHAICQFKPSIRQFKHAICQGKHLKHAVCLLKHPIFHFESTDLIQTFSFLSR